MARPSASAAAPLFAGLENHFDAAFATRLALREKQIQQNYRPVIGIHKWFARRPGTIFRSLLLAEFCRERPLSEAYWEHHSLKGTIGDPFMGGGTPLFEANRLGFDVVGCDINPMAHWIVCQSFADLDINLFRSAARSVQEDVAREIARYYSTRCLQCGKSAQVKYFLLVKTATCPHCQHATDLFPGYRLAEAERHPKHVLLCARCGELNEFDVPPTRSKPKKCHRCKANVHIEGNVSNRKVECTHCEAEFKLDSFERPPVHRMWAIEYHCSRCYADHDGRLFKAPDERDLENARAAERMLDHRDAQLPIPSAEIPPGDESDRLHRWGYRRYRDMFTPRQLLGLGGLLARIKQTEQREIRHALLTVFSDILRYQNLLCRYDTYALKCQDIFSVHGYPVGFIQCENNLLGIERVGSGSWVHFVEKYARAKEYCAAPFETRHNGNRKELVRIPDETISARLVSRLQPHSRRKQACLINAPAQTAPVARGSLDGVFTDPPYFDNVQYAELIDFCFAWLRLGLTGDVEGFDAISTRSSNELTGNETLGRGLAHFTSGLSEVFSHFGGALKPGAPFVFTYHHNDPLAYVPLVVAILDAGLACVATLPAAAEMAASLHISGTNSSVLDTVFVCRRAARRPQRHSQMQLPFAAADCAALVAKDVERMRDAGVKVGAGDERCLLAGHLARAAIDALSGTWPSGDALPSRIAAATDVLSALSEAAVGPGGRRTSKRASRQRSARCPIVSSLP
jgi:adenine-specific DNA methylase